MPTDMTPHHTAALRSRQKQMARHWFTHTASVLLPNNTTTPDPEPRGNGIVLIARNGLEIRAYNHGGNNLSGHLKWDTDHNHAINFYIKENATPNEIQAIARRVRRITNTLNTITHRTTPPTT